jgi:probable F420-dependent oxidoreductase
VSGLALGLVSPIVNLNPRFDPPAWEIEGTVDDLVAVARAADRLGYHWVSCPEHVAVPVALADRRGGRYFDPVATLAYLAAATERIGLLSHVVVLGYHHPLALVKQYGTLDLLSGGRVILGVGVGSLEAEFDLLGAEFIDRGARADDALGAIRAAFGQPEPSYEGAVYSFSGFRVEPSGVQDRLPIWVGGRTRRSLRRALAHGDGWIPFGLDADALGTMLADPQVAELLSQRAGAAGSAGGQVEPDEPGAVPFELVLAPEPPLDPVGDPDATLATVERYRAMGATGLALRFVSRSRDHYLEQLAALRQIVPDGSLDAGRPTGPM